MLLALEVNKNPALMEWQKRNMNEVTRLVKLCTKLDTATGFVTFRGWCVCCIMDSCCAIISTRAVQQYQLVLCNSINSCCAIFSTPAMQQFSTPAMQQFSTKPHIHSNTHFSQPNSNHLSPEFCNSTFSYPCHLVKYVFQEVRNVRKATGKGVCSYPFVCIPFGSLGADRLPLCAARPKPWRQERLPCQGTRPSSQRRPLL